MKYIFLIFSFFLVQACKGQDEKIKSIKVLEKSITICGQNRSSQEDYSSIKNWTLSNEDIINIIQKSEKINDHILHYSYGNLPCEIKGKISIAGKIKNFVINAGGYYYYYYYYYLDNEIYGCNSPDCYKYFPKEAQQEDDATLSKKNEIDHKVLEEFYGDYSLTIDYGKLDEFSEMSIDYDITIKKDSCIFSGLGYKTYFSDICNIDGNSEVVVLKYLKQIDGDGMSPHDNIDTLALFYKKNNKYYIKSKIIADKNSKYDTTILLKKKINNIFNHNCR